MVRLCAAILRGAMRPGGPTSTRGVGIFARPVGWRGWPGAGPDTGG
jgi:hypothetical protein